MNKFRYEENKYLEEISNYIKSTYNAHYSGRRGSQTFDFILSAGHGNGFCMGSVMKYAARFGKKEGWNRNDLLKLIHYAILALYVFDLENDKIEGEVK